MNILDLVEELGQRPRRKAALHGGEYCSPCPFCKGGDDRFLIWPQRPNKNGELQGGRFACRVCGKYGDAITFLRELHGLSYRDACARLRIEPKKGSFTPAPRIPQLLPIAEEPTALWQEKAAAFVAWCNRQIGFNPDALKTVMARGFTAEAIERYKIGYCPETYYRQREEWGLEPQLKEDGTAKKLWLPRGLVVPTFVADGRLVKVKVRRADWQDGDKYPKYAELSGSKRCPSVYGNAALPAALILESELDALLVQQLAADLIYCVALGGATKPIDRDTDALLRRTRRLLFCPDYDTAGALAWAKWQRTYPNVERILTPQEKSPGDAYIAGTDLRAWIEAHLQKEAGETAKKTPRHGLTATAPIPLVKHA